MKISTAFSPNGDGKNDTWNLFSDNNNARGVTLQTLYPTIRILVYDRLGTEVFSSAKGYPQPWDGAYNGYVLPIDSYPFIIDLGNSEKPVRGQITILK